jgi:methylase of polypeptide subunit release factors
MTDSALQPLLTKLKAVGYHFTTPAPSTHRRVLTRRTGQVAHDLIDVFGWNMRFADGLLPTDILAALHAAQGVTRVGAQWISRYRVASLDDHLFVHSAFPTDQHSVFFGPDSYRFAHFIQRAAPPLDEGARILDIGAGAGVGGLIAATLSPQAHLTLTDVNATALALAEVNAKAAGFAPELVFADGLPPGDEAFDLIVANPPYIGGAPGKTYADGGGELGLDLSIEWARAAVQRLAPGGRFLLYSGSAITRGLDPLRTALAPIAQAAGCSFRYDELDPDVFPAMLIQPAYWGVERIAAVGAVFEKPAPAPPSPL